MNSLTQFDLCMLMLGHYLQYVSYVQSPGEVPAHAGWVIQLFYARYGVKERCRHGIELSHL